MTLIAGSTSRRLFFLLFTNSFLARVLLCWWMTAIKLLLVFYHRASRVAGSLIEISDRQGLCTFHGRGWLLPPLRPFFSVVCGGARSSGSHFPKSTPFWFKEQKVGYQSRGCHWSIFFFPFLILTLQQLQKKKKRKKKKTPSHEAIYVWKTVHACPFCPLSNSSRLIFSDLKDFMTLFLIPVQWNTLLSSRSKKRCTLLNDIVTFLLNFTGIQLKCAFCADTFFTSVNSICGFRTHL